MSSSVMHVREQQHAKAHERDAGDVEIKRTAEDPADDHQHEGYGRDPLVARHLSHVGELLARRRGGVGCLAHARREDLRDERGAASRIATSDGTEEARSQLPKLISSPAFCAICTPIGLAEVAVIQRADEIARLAIPQNMR